MSTLHPCGSRRFTAVLLALAVVISGMGSAFLPSAAQTALAADGVALGDAVILAGPGGQYGILTVAPAGSSMSVDGDPVDGYYPVTFDGVGGWTATGLIDAGGNGNGGGGKNKSDRDRSNGNGGVETVSADPVYTDGSAPAETSTNAEPISNAEPITGGAYGPGGSSYSEDQIVDIIYEAADNYGQSRDDMLRVARCESGLNPSAVGGGGAYYGLFQFVPSTFSQTPYGQYDIFDPWANANAAAWTWSEVGRGGWSCQ